jgi:hypothetical protein
MNYPFKNCLLVVVFNYNNCVVSKNFFEQLYAPYFKKIIFYSDLGNEYTGVHNIDIFQGYFAYRFYSHLWNSYQSEISQSGGVFYLMDDNIVNPRILENMNPSKIIGANTDGDWIPQETGWWWSNNCNGAFGNLAIDKIKADSNFIKYSNIDFVGSFGDFLYIPTKYITQNLINLIEIFSKYNLFLEIAIPTICNYLSKDESSFNVYDKMILWNDRERFDDLSFVKKCLLEDEYLFLHPIKVNNSPENRKTLARTFFQIC